MTQSLGALYVAETVGIEVYELDALGPRAQATQIDGAWVIYVRSGLRRKERDGAIFRMLGVIRQKALSAPRPESVQSIALH